MLLTPLSWGKKNPTRNEREEGKGRDPSAVSKGGAETRDDLHSVACEKRKQWLSYSLQSVVVLFFGMTHELVCTVKTSWPCLSSVTVRHNTRTEQFSKSLVGVIKLLSGTIESKYYYSIKFTAVQSYTMQQVNQISCFKARYDCLRDEESTSCP